MKTRHTIFFRPLALASVIGCLQQAGAGQPEWIRHRPVSSEYYVGIGCAEKSPGSDWQGSARKSALADLAAETSIQLESESEVRTEEERGIFNSRFQSRIRSRTNQELRGYERVGQWEDAHSGCAYFRLSKAAFEMDQNERLEILLNSAIQMEKEADQAFLESRPAAGFMLAGKALGGFDSLTTTTRSPQIDEAQARILHAIMLEAGRLRLGSPTGAFPLQVRYSGIGGGGGAAGIPVRCGDRADQLMFSDSAGWVSCPSSSHDAGAGSRPVPAGMRVLSARVSTEELLGKYVPAMEGLLPRFSAVLRYHGPNFSLVLASKGDSSNRSLWLAHFQQRGWQTGTPDLAGVTVTVEEMAQCTGNFEGLYVARAEAALRLSSINPAEATSWMAGPEKAVALTCAEALVASRRALITHVAKSIIPAMEERVGVWQIDTFPTNHQQPKETHD